MTPLRNSNAIISILSLDSTPDSESADARTQQIRQLREVLRHEPSPGLAAPRSFIVGGQRVDDALPPGILIAARPGEGSQSR
jgi:hypothetical protein